jgi:hypothetical protein
MSSALLIVLWAAVTIAGIGGLVASVNNMRLEHRVISEANAMLNAAAGPRAIDRATLEKLPAPVRRYLTSAIGTRPSAARAVRLRQRGTFRPDLQGKWYPLEGEQYFTGDPPAFIWWGRVRIAPGIWIDARDRSVAGAGNMLVMMESTFPLANASGPALDQGALLRLLGELVWMPATYLDDRYIHWSAIDDRHAAAIFTVSGRSVTGGFAFGDDGLPARFTADRFRDLGGGNSALTPFLGEYRDYRRVEGMLVPYEVAGSWVIDGMPQKYARFNVVRMEFDPGGASED